MKRLSTAFRATVLCLVRLYRKGISGWFAPSCRFHPSCSEYCEQAVRIHGAGRGLALTALRLLKCHPFHPGGVDWPPPPRRSPAGQPSEAP
ncbi:membrane protein insertion efficiency factor YidD [Kiritimatiella glycovorans]|uniref:membrane protein insertion efficiency factor YidD n=1 Tax=Kiritimatiella glycovorans TaxID=1307763 RepID=UPI00093B3C94|nr:membrane protein insertion efficiency factor YidD [Kiritimatiella glycovorans]